MGQMILKDLPENSSLYNDMKDIVAAGDRCKKIIQSMLGLVRKSNQEKQNVNLLPIIKNACNLIKPEAKRLGIKIDFNDLNSNFNAYGDSNQLLQVFFHLLQHSYSSINEKLKNKNKFSPFINIAFAQDNEMQSIIIKDNGINSIHFYDSNSSVSYAVAKMLIEDHGGKINFNTVNNCNVQSIYLPQIQK